MSAMYEEWVSDIPCQFRNQKNIDILIRAFSRQLDEVKAMHRQLVVDTDLDAAVGKNLDMIGDIVNMSRRDAGILMNRESVKNMDDESYRKALRFQALKNNSNAAYPDIMKGLSFLWEGAHLNYEEAKLEPACIVLGVEGVAMDDLDPGTIKPMVIRAGGVKILFRVTYREPVDMSGWEKFKVYWFTQVGHRWDGRFKWDGEIEFHSDQLIYNRWDGSLKFDGSAQWKESVGKEDIELGNAILLNQAKRKMLEMRHNGSNGWKIAGMVLGNGLADDGSAYEPTPEQTGLKHEVLRKDFESIKKVDPAGYLYEVVLLETEHVGESFSEVGLYDTDGMVLCVKTFDKKIKSADVEMVLQIEDTF